LLTHCQIGLEVGFIPFRGDFSELEYENDAELLIAEMEITEHDTPQERGTLLIQ
jgi:hypothetical protein